MASLMDANAFVHQFEGAGVSRDALRDAAATAECVLADYVGMGGEAWQECDGRKWMSDDECLQRMHLWQHSCGMLPRYFAFQNFKMVDSPRGRLLHWPAVFACAFIKLALNSLWVG
jgi:hypothetical protein